MRGANPRASDRRTLRSARQRSVGGSKWADEHANARPARRRFLTREETTMSSVAHDTMNDKVADEQVTVRQRTCRTMHRSKRRPRRRRRSPNTRRRRTASSIWRSPTLDPKDMLKKHARLGLADAEARPEAEGVASRRGRRRISTRSATISTPSSRCGCRSRTSACTRTIRVHLWVEAVKPLVPGRGEAVVLPGHEQVPADPAVRPRRVDGRDPQGVADVGADHGRTATQRRSRCR